MTVRAYIPPAVPLDELTVENKRKRIVMERKGVDRVVFTGPDKLLLMFSNGKQEMVGHNDYCIEVIEGDTNDGISGWKCNKRSILRRFRGGR